MPNIEWKPDKKSPMPLYRQISLYIKNKIENGEWPVGSKIPSQRMLANTFNVNRSTITTALDELAAEGLILGKSGRGTVVMNNTWSLLSSNLPPDWISYVNAGAHKPNQLFIQEINRSEFDPSIIRLGTGELSPELLPNEMMKEIFKKSAEKMKPLSYEEPKGLLFLRKEISRRLEKYGISVSPSSILIVSGALQALQLISVGLLRKGSTILLEEPSYLYSLHVFQSADMRLSGLPIDDEGIQINNIAYNKQQKNGALLYTIPSFHNPTGIVMSIQRRKQLLEICEKERLPIIEDDVYRDLWIDEQSPYPLKSMDKNGIVLYLGSMSKSLSPGLRIGWVVGPQPVIERLADIKMQTDYGSSSLSQWIAAEWFASGLYDEHLQYIRQQLKVRRKVTLSALNKYFSDIATWNIPKGGFYIWLKLNDKVYMHELFSKSLERGILINPGSIYEPQSSCSLRISYSYASLEDIEKGLYTISQVVREIINDGSIK
ncbi:PLP-dependent aminotransferase family protein [Tissierella sp. MSJ-40]|uniref:PLP-dependent aminotransferase family protein n=1 Tax=Tissierella simiarum TaxID=2841534 RepID=A0ABS6E4J1_9FIRM|nr:PLP-dependent aminotransferase family protein [Tissierella simiarum]MBU5437827.1 PLP-dependent aminotransferase family protein [Tissierella simiarum]